jgi:hypothetical protein
MNAEARAELRLGQPKPMTVSSELVADHRANLALC